MEAGKEEPTPKLIKLISLEFNVSTEYFLSGNNSERQNYFDLSDENFNFSVDIIEETKNELRSTNNKVVTDYMSGLMADLLDLYNTIANNSSQNFSTILISDLIIDFVLSLIEKLRCIEENTTKENILLLLFDGTNEYNKMVEEIKNLYFKRVEAQSK